MTILRLLVREPLRETRLPGATDGTRYGEGRASPEASPRTTLLTRLHRQTVQAAARPTPKPSSTPQARACYTSRMGSCKVCVSERRSNSAVAPVIACVALMFTLAERLELQASADCAHMWGGSHGP